MVLLELVIALGLAAILLTFLFRFFAAYMQIDQKLDRAREVLHQRQHFQVRLSSIFASAVPHAPSSTSLPSFHTNENSELIIIFDNGVDPHPQFGGPILAKISLDAHSNLTLTLWPLQKTEPEFYRKEILLADVQSVQFQFLSKKSSQGVDPSAIPINHTLEWRTDWPKSLGSIPSMIRIIVNQNNCDVAYAFTLPFLEPIVTYGETGGSV